MGCCAISYGRCPSPPSLLCDPTRGDFRNGPFPEAWGPSMVGALPRGAGIRKSRFAVAVEEEAQEKEEEPGDTRISDSRHDGGYVSPCVFAVVAVFVVPCSGRWRRVPGITVDPPRGVSFIMTPRRASYIWLRGVIR
ncbi:unnamed protein product [Prorocentrum cordatum]|uniref:Uncharacterized protein n=1 Tax=Prorocentrum cordatum TaxID=2364126 RepID=A0ABN9PD09_9DINO|nr:unnamed protein product [Polarella glacialis]